MPYAFTQEGVAMLSGLLRSDVAVRANITIMRAFVAMRTRLLSLEKMSSEISSVKHSVSELNHYVDDILKDQNDINEDVFQQLQRMNESLAEMYARRIELLPQDRKRIGFK